MILLETVTVEGIEEFGISAVLMLIGILALMTICFLKFMNVVRLNDFYDKEHIFTTIFAASIFYGIVFVSLMIHPVLSFAIYLYICTFLYALIWIFFVAEIIILPANAVTDHKETRLQRQSGYK